MFRGANLGSMRRRGRNQFFMAAFLRVEGRVTRSAKDGLSLETENLSMGAAAVIVGAALALFVGMFILVANQYGGSQEAQVAQHDTTPGSPANELPIAPLAPPAHAI